MTGGRVVVIGSTGRNFAAGMSGGIAYVLNADGDFERRCNPGMVDLEPLADDGLLLVEELLTRHVDTTGSTVAGGLLAEWDTACRRFVRVMPRDYKRVLQAEARARAEARQPQFAELIGAQ